MYEWPIIDVEGRTIPRASASPARAHALGAEELELDMHRNIEQDAARQDASCVY